MDNVKLVHPLKPLKDKDAPCLCINNETFSEGLIFPVPPFTSLHAKLSVLYSRQESLRSNIAAVLTSNYYHSLMEITSLNSALLPSEVAAR